MFIGGKTGEKSGGGNGRAATLLLRVIAEVDFAEGIATVMFDVARHVDAQEHGGTTVARVDTIAGDEVPFAGWEDDRLGPQRSFLFTWCSGLVTIGRDKGSKIFATDHLRLQAFGLRADLWAFE